MQHTLHTMPAGFGGWPKALLLEKTDKMGSETRSYGEIGQLEVSIPVVHRALGQLWALGTQFQCRNQ